MLRFWRHLLSDLENMKVPGESGYCAVVLQYKGDMESHRELGIVDYGAALGTCCWPRPPAG